MSSSRDQWLRKAPSRATERLRKIITLPAFSAECGQDNASLLIDSFGGYVVPVVGYATGFSANLTNAFTFDCWLKLYRPTVAPSTIIWMDAINSIGPYVFKIVIDPTADLMTISITTTTATYSFDWECGSLYTDWHRFTVTWGTVANKLRLYINKVEVASVITAGNFYNKANWGISLGVGFVSSFNGRIAEVKLYNRLFSEFDLYSTGDAPTSQPADNSLKAYIKCIQEAAGFIPGTVNNVNMFLPGSISMGANPPFNTIDTEDYPPLSYGASFIAKRFDLTMLNRCSLRFPLTAPNDVNFGLFVSWMDDNGDTQRRQLWTVDGVDIAPAPDAYSGERLPLTFSFECWNIDGQDTIDLTEDFIIETSLTSQPSQANDYTQEDAGTLVGNTKLAANFSLTPFPLVFNSQQTY